MDKDFLGYRIANNNKIEFLKYVNQNDKFVDCNRDEISVLGTYKNMLRDEIRNKVLSRIYGFIQSHQNKDMKFKIVDKTKETGATKNTNKNWLCMWNRKNRKYKEYIICSR